VSRPMASRLVTVGLLLMSAAILFVYHNWMHDRSSEFVVDASMGVSIGLMVAGLLRSRWQPTRSGESRRPCDLA